jgi:hypothetical protein
MLEAVASKAIKKDWEKLAIKLGFLEYDIQNLKSKNKGSPYDTVRGDLSTKTLKILFIY